MGRLAQGNEGNAIEIRAREEIDQLCQIVDRARVQERWPRRLYDERKCPAAHRALDDYGILESLPEPSGVGPRLGDDHSVVLPVAGLRGSDVPIPSARVSHVPLPNARSLAAAA